MAIISVVHVAFGVLAIVLGWVILCSQKGTARHRRLGYLYIAAMLGLNATALMIYRVFQSFGPFHALALMSLASLVAGWVPAYTRRPRHDWLRRHYEGMCWSYVGLMAATAAEIVVRLPFVRGFGWGFGVATGASSFVVVFVGAYLLYRYRDASLEAFRPPAGSSQPASTE